MLKLFVSVLIGLACVYAVSAQTDPNAGPSDTAASAKDADTGQAAIDPNKTSTEPDEIASRLRLWTKDSAEPVYYGEVRSVDARSMKPTGHFQCLALAFIKYEGGVLHYAHKMWGKSPDGSCHYEDITTKKVANRGICVKDSTASAPYGKANATARMSKDNIDYEHSTFRAIDTNKRRVGETAACVPPNGASDILASIKIEGGRFKVMTRRPLDYEVSIEAQDPKNPPKKPVF